MNSSICPLCSNRTANKSLPGQDKRVYTECGVCRMIFVRREDYPGQEEERDRYMGHNNGPQFPGHVRFLNNAIEPALPFLKAGGRGLDYGCGPVPTLSVLMEQRGFECLDYDPFFFPEVPEGSFDFIFCTEAAEHFFDPAREFRKMATLLTRSGILTIMTLMWKRHEDFQTHFYFRDPSHVVFYHTETIEWICSKYGFELCYTDHYRVVVFRKKPEHHESKS